MVADRVEQFGGAVFLSAPNACLEEALVVSGVEGDLTGYWLRHVEMKAEVAGEETSINAVGAKGEGSAQSGGA